MHFFIHFVQSAPLLVEIPTYSLFAHCVVYEYIYADNNIVL